MPQIGFNVGDYVTHTSLGNGIVLNVFSRNGTPLYHIDFFDKNCRYIYGDDINHVTLKRIADEQTIRAAQNLLLEYFNQSQWDDKTRPANEPIIGDIAYHANFGKCLILGPDNRGYHKTGTSSRYHAYCIDINSFAYISNVKCLWRIIAKSNTSSREQANKFWLEHILSQPG